MMRDPIAYYKSDIEYILENTTTQTILSSFELSNEEITERNNFITDFIFKQ
jgi:hypothetical protein